MSADASGGMEDYREEPGRSKLAKGPAPCLVWDSVILHSGISACLPRYLLHPLLILPFCDNPPKLQSRGGWFDINWPG